MGCDHCDESFYGDDMKQLWICKKTHAHQPLNARPLALIEGKAPRIRCRTPLSKRELYSHDTSNLGECSGYKVMCRLCHVYFGYLCINVHESECRRSKIQRPPSDKVVCLCGGYFGPSGFAQHAKNCTAWVRNCTHYGYTIPILYHVEHEMSCKETKINEGTKDGGVFLCKCGHRFGDDFKNFYGHLKGCPQIKAHVYHIGRYFPGAVGNAFSLGYPGNMTFLD